MGTRAVYVFSDATGTHAVYRHWDGYPRAALKFIAAAKAYAWSLPRFEPDEFAAAFVRANKSEAGGVRLINYDKRETCFPVDIEYIYRVKPNGNAEEVSVEVLETNVPDWDKPKRVSKKLFNGPLDKALAWSVEDDA